jgi:hypothetical protein
LVELAVTRLPVGCDSYSSIAQEVHPRQPCQRQERRLDSHGCCRHGYLTGTEVALYLGQHALYFGLHARLDWSDLGKPWMAYLALSCYQAGFHVPSACQATDTLPAFLKDMVPPVLSCLGDNEARVRYFACEALYNIAKVSRTHILHFFTRLFDALCKVLSLQSRPVSCSPFTASLRACSWQQTRTPTSRVGQHRWTACSR